MRAIPIVACLALFACQSENELRFLSSVATETDGVAMSEDGTNSFAAMAGTTCTLDARFGCPTADDDLPTEEEQVWDHYAGETLAASTDTLHFMAGGTWHPGADLYVPALRQARLTQSGVMLVRGDEADCELDHEGTVLPVDGVLCADDVSVEADRTGALVALTRKGALRVSDTGVQVLSKTANRASVDPSLRQVYLATAGNRSVEAKSSSGKDAWTVEVEGRVSDLATRGDKGEVVVLAEAEDGLGEITILDGSTGKELSTHRIPSADGHIEVSGNGRVMAFVTDTEVHHFEIVVDGEDPMPKSEDPECEDLPTRAGSSMGLD